MMFFNELKTLYDSIDSKNFLPQPQSNISSNETCVCLWANVNENEHNITPPNLDCVSRSSDVVYNIVPSAKDGILHTTLFQFQTFGIDVSYDTVIKNGETVESVLRNFPRLSIEFRGVMRVKHGIVMCGYPSYNINRVRDEFRHAIKDIAEPHPQDICHMTIIRFGENVDDRIADINAFVKRHKDTAFGCLNISSWNYGYGTWMQTTAKIIRTIHTPEWIFHRGLSMGPDKSLENSMDNLFQMINDGWSVETDLWMIDGNIYIGHDNNNLKLVSSKELKCLFDSPRVYIHCKNLEMLGWITTQTLAAQYFFHDKDDAVLTSKNIPWCYPGKFCNGCIIVLPELLPENPCLFLKTVRGVCSDFGPKHFVH
jgi:hypothetical protein